MLYETPGLWSEEHNLGTWTWWNHRRGPRLHAKEKPYSLPASGRAALPFNKKPQATPAHPLALQLHAYRTQAFAAAMLMTVKISKTTQPPTDT